jgi:hypothetical protein
MTDFAATMNAARAQIVHPARGRPQAANEKEKVFK